MAEYSETGDHQDFLKQLREEYSSDDTDWKPIRDEGRTDIRYIAGDPWEPVERRYREQNNRLCLTFDELGQYVNQTVNDILQNRRAIQVTANGLGANDKEAEVRANRIRQIEYVNNAQVAYTTMFENAVQRSFGWTRLNTRWGKNQREQDIVIEPVPNPDMVTPGWFVMPDGSDIKRLWFHESWTQTDFLRKYPQATVRDFSGMADDPGLSNWIQSETNRIMLAEYWRKNDDGTVEQFLTNGVEILTHAKTVWKEIPFIPCFGKVMFIEEGGRSKRLIQSMARLAREPFRAYCYVRTTEAELISQLPKFPYFAYKGALDDKNAMELTKSVSEPVAVVFVENQFPDNASAGPPPYPQRNPVILELQGLEIAAESFRRAIQAAFAQSALPTQAQKHNEKSGVALQKIEDSGQRGSYHFTAHYEGAVTRIGKAINGALGPIHDTPRDMTVRKADDSTQVMRVNDPSWVNPDTQQPELVAFTDGDYDVTISTGPKVDSEREAASNFADLIIQSPEIAQIVGPQKMADILATVIKLKNVGPLGDQIAEIISPKKKDGDTQQQLQQMQQQQQQTQVVMDAQTKQIEGLTQQIQTEQVKADLQLRLQAMKDATSIKVAWLNVRAKGILVNMEADEEAIALGLEQQHEAGQNEQDRQHEAALSAMEHQQQLEAGQQQGAQQSQLADQGHQQALEQGAQGHEQQLEQGAQAAALAPQPEA